VRFAAATFFIIHPCHVSDRSGVAAHSDGKGQQVDLASSGHLDTQTNAMRMLRVPTPANTAYCLSLPSLPHVNETPTSLLRIERHACAVGGGGAYCGQV
jgi:hypothetical protein